jgi:hypothetical protein
MEGLSCRLVVITPDVYNSLKKNLGRYDEWLNTEHMGIVSSWFLCNHKSQVSDTFDVIRHNFVSMMEDFYSFMMFSEGRLKLAKSAWTVHCFLCSCGSLLFKRFIFFEQNVNRNHWVSTCLCNPWYFLLQYYKREKKNEIPEDLEGLDEDDFIHGFLMFDPQIGFIAEKDMDEKKKQQRNLYVWLMNLASFYYDAKSEGTLGELDFHMHCHLKREMVDSWKSRFNIKGFDWEAYMTDTNEFKENMPPDWFVFVAKWFMHGLNGPFGKITFFSKPYLSNIFKNSSKKAGKKFLPIRPNLIPGPSSVSFKQDDSCNCGVCCCLFMFDLVITQIAVSWIASLSDNGELPSSIQFGSSILSKTKCDALVLMATNFNLQKHLNSLYKLFREEIVVLIKRLWYLYLENVSGFKCIEKNKDWGNGTKAMKDLQNQFKKEMKGDYNPSNPFHLSAFKDLPDYRYQSKEFMDRNHVIVFPTSNFCNGELSSINFILGTGFPSKFSFHEILLKLYPSSIKEYNTKMEKNRNMIQEVVTPDQIPEGVTPIEIDNSSHSSRETD